MLRRGAEAPVLVLPVLVLVLVLTVRTAPPGLPVAAIRSGAAHIVADGGMVV